MAERIPVFVPLRDRLSPLLELLAWLDSAGLDEVWLVDNGSTYPPLLAFLDETPHHVVRLEANLGHRAPWLAGVVQRVAWDCRYVATDPDVVPDDGCPLDAVERFSVLLDRHPDIEKVGFGLRIDDLPAHYPLAGEVRAWEAQFWQDEVEPGVYRADIDTTFALYRPPKQRHPNRLALRTGPPYVARHLPWYDDPRELSDEERYYRAHADPTVSNWNRDRAPRWKELRLRAQAEV